MSKLLSICIPTYNMCNYLEINLKEIVEIISDLKLEDEIEVCISDNQSTDDTELMVSKYFNLNIDIKYHKNQKNIGADRNFLKSVEISNGKYSWILGADDILIKEGLLNIINLIKNSEYHIILGDRLNINLNGDNKEVQFWSKEKSIVSKNNLSVFIDNSYKLGAIFAYISSIVFKKENWDDAIQILDINKFIGSSYIHSLILLSIIKNNGNMLYLHKPIVKSRLGNDSFLSAGYFNRIKIDFNYLDILDYLFGKSSQEYKSTRVILDKERVFLHFLKAKYIVSKDDSLKYEFNSFLDELNIKNKYLIKTIPNFIIKILLELYKWKSNETRKK
jgi:abequosyltransferase